MAVARGARGGRRANGVRRPRHRFRRVGCGTPCRDLGACGRAVRRRFCKNIKPPHAVIAVVVGAAVAFNSRRRGCVVWWLAGCGSFVRMPRAISRAPRHGVRPLRLDLLDLLDLPDFPDAQLLHFLDLFAPDLFAADLFALPEDFFLLDLPLPEAPYESDDESLSLLESEPN